LLLLSKNIRLSISAHAGWFSRRGKTTNTVSVDYEGLFTGKGIRELETIKNKGVNINYILINLELSNKFGLAGTDRSWS
jgi:hypothetical protein